MYAEKRQYSVNCKEMHSGTLGLQEWSSSDDKKGSESIGSYGENDVRNKKRNKNHTLENLYHK